jgi:tRNA(Ile)-lysidine synthase
LTALLEAERQPWLDDPSNRAPAFARGRLRAGLPLDGRALGQLAHARASERAARDRASASWLARHARIEGAGFVLLDRPALADALPELAQRILQQTLLAVGGSDYAPRRARLDRLLAGLRAGAGKRGWTLAGCRLLLRAGCLLVCREAGVVSEVLAAQAGRWQRWDRRFVVQAGGAGGRLEVRALGIDGWRQARRADAQWRDLPAPVGPGLPGLWRGSALLALPRLAPRVLDGKHAPTFEARFRPHHPLSGAPFAPSLPYDAATRGEEIFASGVG